MRKYSAVLAAFGASHFQLTDAGHLEEPNVFMFDDGTGRFDEVIAAAERLFDYAVKYKYGPEVLYRQQAAWAGFEPHNWDHVPEPMRIAFTLFHAATNALAPFIEQAPAAEPERKPETRSHGFEKGFDDEGEGRGQKIGDERLPMMKPAPEEKLLADHVAGMELHEPSEPEGIDVAIVPDAEHLAGSNISEHAIEPAAAHAHEINREYCQIIGDSSQVSWEDAPDWQRHSAINGVRFAIANGFPEPSVMHENWMKEKLADGWTLGETKDVEKKQHPCLVPYDQLPEAQRLKDELFRHAVMQSLGKGRGDDIALIFSYAAARFAPPAPNQADQGAASREAGQEAAQAPPATPDADAGRPVPHHGSGPDNVGTERPPKPAKGKRHK